MTKRLLMVVALTALLGLQFADCMSAMTQDQQSMKCCGSMPCDPSNQSHDCCKGMVSSQSPSVLPVAHVTLHAPVMVATEILASPQIVTYSEVSRLDFEARPHSPPELYTLDGHPLKFPWVSLPLHFAVLSMQSVPIPTISFQRAQSIEDSMRYCLAVQIRGER